VSCFRFIAAERDDHSVSTMCRVLGVSRSGFYAWRSRPPSATRLRDWGLIYHVRRIHQISRRTYGAPRIHAELRADGVAVAKKRVARLMGQQGLEGAHRRRFRKTTVRDESSRPAPDLVERDFTVTGPNELWVADITYVRTWAGWLYVAVVVDAYSRMVVGWSMRDDLKACLVVDALRMARWRRRPSGRVVHHSDQGSQYTSFAFGRTVREAKIIDVSMGSVGDAFDNAMAESFFASLKTELVDRHSWPTRQAARTAIYEYIEGWYNPRRRHSALGYLSPADYEKIHRKEPAQAA
jgi:putative transposase